MLSIVGVKDSIFEAVLTIKDREGDTYVVYSYSEDKLVSELTRCGAYLYDHVSTLN